MAKRDMLMDCDGHPGAKDMMQTGIPNVGSPDDMRSGPATPARSKPAVAGAHRRTLLQLAVCASLVAPVRARADSDSAAVLDPVTTLNRGLIAIMKAGKSRPFLIRYNIMVPAVETAFDLKDILRRCTNPRWSMLTVREQTNLLDVFRRFTVTSYVANFDSYAGETFEINPVPRAVGSDLVVETHIVPASGQATRVDYVMRKQGGAWQAVDVLLNGTISRVAVQRSDFHHLISDGDVSDLMSSMQQRIAMLSDGSLRS